MAARIRTESRSTRDSRDSDASFMAACLSILYMAIITLSVRRPLTLRKILGLSSVSMRTVHIDTRGQARYQDACINAHALPKGYALL
jgi:hypothetical protein